MEFRVEQPQREKPNAEELFRGRHLELRSFHYLDHASATFEGEGGGNDLFYGPEIGPDKVSVSIHPCRVPLPSKLGTYKKVRTGFWSWLSGEIS